MLALGNLGLRMGRQIIGGLVEPIADVPSEEFSDPDNPEIVEDGLPNGVQVSRIARSYNNSGDPPSAPPGLTGSPGNGKVTWTVTPGESVDGVRLYPAANPPARKPGESEDSEVAEATPIEMLEVSDFAGSMAVDAIIASSPQAQIVEVEDFGGGVVTTANLVE